MLSKIKEKSPKTHVVLMTGFAEVKTAVQAMKKGAFDYISKPFTPESILEIITSALDANDSEALISQETDKNVTRPSNQIVGNSEASKKLQHYIELVAPTNMSVLLIGESGTGKEVTARAIHDISERRNENFVAGRIFL